MASNPYQKSHTNQLNKQHENSINNYVILAVILIKNKNTNRIWRNIFISTFYNHDPSYTQHSSKLAQEIQVTLTPNKLTMRCTSTMPECTLIRPYISWGKTLLWTEHQLRGTRIAILMLIKTDLAPQDPPQSLHSRHWFCSLWISAKGWSSWIDTTQRQRNVTIKA